MNPYRYGIRLALHDAGLAKEAAQGMPFLGYLGMPLVGAGVGAVADLKDPGRGARIGALGGLGAALGVRLGTGKLTSWLRSQAKTGKSLSDLLADPVYGPNVRRWMGKRIGAGAVLGASGLGAGIGLGFRQFPEKQPLSSLGDMFSLTPQRAQQLQALVPTAQQLYAASQGQAPLPDLSEFASPETQLQPKVAQVVETAELLARKLLESKAKSEARELMGIENPSWRPAGLSTVADAIGDKVNDLLGIVKTEPTPEAAAPVLTG